MATQIQLQELAKDKAPSKSPHSSLDSEASPVKLIMSKRSTMNSESEFLDVERTQRYSLFLGKSEEEMGEQAIKWLEERKIFPGTPESIVKECADENKKKVCRKLSLAIPCQRRKSSIFEEKVKH